MEYKDQDIYQKLILYPTIPRDFILSFFLKFQYLLTLYKL